MGRELKLFFVALSFYTRIPVPAAVHRNNAANLPDSIRYLPVVGWVAGAISAAVYVAANYLFDASVAVVLSMMAGLLITGAFHEDGFADVCDGFGGGWTKERILEIMKDSRLGTYGVCGMILILGLKFTTLHLLFSEGGFPFSEEHFPVYGGHFPVSGGHSLTSEGHFLISKGDTLIPGGLLHHDVFTILLLLIVAHSLSRFAAITIVFNYKYARIAESKASGAVEKGQLKNLLFAAIFTVLPLAGLMMATSSLAFGLIVIPVLLAAWAAGRYFKRWIGGYTGDCLGAVQQITEVIIYLSYILIWKFT